MNRRASEKKAPMRFGPPQIVANPIVNHRFRFVANSTLAANVTCSNIFGIGGCVATSSTTGKPIFQTMKVNRIECWAPPASQGSASTVTVLFPNALKSPAKDYTDTSVSVAEPAHVIAVPPSQALCSFWFGDSTSDILFTINAPSGTIIDLWVSGVFQDGAANANVMVLVGATTGAVYYACLDSLTNASGVAKPIALSVV